MAPVLQFISLKWHIELIIIIFLKKDVNSFLFNYT